MCHYKLPTTIVTSLTLGNLPLALFDVNHGSKVKYEPDRPNVVDRLVFAVKVNAIYMACVDVWIYWT